MSVSQHSEYDATELPKARVGKDWKTHLFWLVPLGAALLAAWFIYNESHKGPKIHIYFSDATRLARGKSEVLYRGATIGEVEDLQLTSDTKQVKVTVSLKKSASEIAREQSQFWIVKAQVGAAQVRGLGTIVSGDYIAVEPGGGKPQTEFQGLDQAPVVARPGSVRIVLLAERLGTLMPRSPVFYRGLQVGEIASCQLGEQAQVVRINLDILKQYAPLVRLNSVFWKAGGIDVDLSLSGAEISAQSLRTLVAGAIDFATPDTNEKPAMQDTSFRLYERPRDEWLGWAPAIEIGQTDPVVPRPVQPNTRGTP